MHELDLSPAYLSPLQHGNRVHTCSCSLAASLAENQELSSRLIDLALRNEDDGFDAAFGDPRPPASQAAGAKTLGQIDTSAVKQRQEALAEQVRGCRRLAGTEGQICCCVCQSRNGDFGDADIRVVSEKATHSCR